MLNVLVLFGGRSPEHDISLVSASAVIDNIPKDKYNIIPVGITSGGRWLLTDDDTDKIRADEWESTGKNVLLSQNYGDRLLYLPDTGEKITVDVCFPVLHGANGEDGTLQGLLSLAGIPFVGCKCLSSAMTMDKAISNAIARDAGIDEAKWITLTSYEFSHDRKILESAGEELGYPLFVKPANAGSSVGVSKVHAPGELAEAIEKAFGVDSKIVLEECIFGREVECAVLGNDEIITSEVGEIVPYGDFYGFDSKYNSGGKSLTLIPAELPREISQMVKSNAAKIYKALCCSGLSRCDFFVTDDGRVKFNEINTMPGFTPISMYPMLMKHAGIDTPDLVDRLIALALEET